MMIRVIRVIDRLNVGGPAKHVVWLTEGLRSAGFETTLVAGTVAEAEGDMSYFARDAGVEPLYLEEMSRELSPLDLIVVAKLVRLFFKTKPDVIHTHKAKAGAVGRAAALVYKWATPSALLLRPRRCRIVHTYHGHIFHSYYGRLKTRLFIAIERVLAWWTDRIVAISEQQRREISDRFGVGRPEKFRVIPLGIDLAGLSSSGISVRPEIAADPDELLIGIVGRLCEIKNHALLLEAAAKLGAKNQSSGLRFRIVIIGDGHLRAELERLAQELDLTGRVVFTGFRNDATELYRDLDVVALTSLNEGTPLTLIEAMSCGRPIVATEVGGVVDIMGARRETTAGVSIWDHGLTVPTKDADALVRALQWLIAHPAARREMGERGKAFVESCMSKTRLIEDVKSLYQELCGADVTAPATASTVLQSE